MLRSADAIVAQALQSLDTTAAPATLQELITQHQRNLLNLACALLTGGQTEKVVQQTIDDVFASFKNQLMLTIFELRC